MHSVCPQIRPAAFNRFGCDFLFSLAWQTAQTAPSTPSPPPPCTQPPAVQSVFFSLPLLPFLLSVSGLGEEGREEGVGKKEGGQRAMLGEKKRGHDSICAVCGWPWLGASCVHLAPNVAWGPWHTDGLSHLLQIPVKDLCKKNLENEPKNKNKKKKQAWMNN